MGKRKICVVTGTRAEYGLLSNLMKIIQMDEQFELQIIATGMHLSPEFGLTYKQIETDGFEINEKVEMLLSADTSTAVAKSMGLATIGFADAYERLKPDLLIILGDRFEMLAASQTALVMQIPIAHIHGGECTFGAYDDAIRHSITKMSTWHFTSTERHRKRVIQLGEHPKRVFNVGAIGIENIYGLNLLSKKALYDSLNITNNKPFFLITQHPETNGASENIQELLKALVNYEEYNLVFTKSNADNGGRYINEQIDHFTKINGNTYLFDSLGQLKYLSAIKHATLVIGNSSSGLVEVPYLHTPTVNIGDRQAGRPRPCSVFDVKIDADQIIQTINEALDFKGEYQYIFGKGKASEQIIEALKSLEIYKVQKGFHDL